MSITYRLSEFVVATPASDIPVEVARRAITLTTDLIGSTFRAAQDSDSSPAMLDMVEMLGLGGAGPCTVFGLNRRFGAAAAALLNGAFGHSLDFDDTHAASSLHPSAPVVPAALAVAELTGASGPETVAAIVMGYEACCRLGVALDPAAHYARGFHPTATAGNFGAAIAAGRLLGLDAAAMNSALGIAASQASGSLQFLANGAWNKRYQVGEAAMKGVMAATLAAKGFKGACEALEGNHGFLRGYSDRSSPERVVAELGVDWETMRIALKPYPACRYTHAAVDGLLAMQRQHHWQSDEITAVTIGLHTNGIALVGDPLESKQKARSIVEGQFSMPFAGAVALLRGRFGWDDYDLLGAQEAEALAARISVHRDLSLEGLDHPFGASVEVEARGQVHRLVVSDPSGEPASFPDDAAVEEKFTGLVRPVLNMSTAVWLERLRALGEAPSLKGYFP
ncbi:MAG: MmgE/PrpD family protein [Sphingopyxis sp.]|nr:MmgE/PrpD family protein [Sphingopyxis sp.]